MPKFCAVINCGSRGNRDDLKFFSFPRVNDTHGRPILGADERKRKWICALQRKDFDEKKAKFAYICEKHFVTGTPSIDPEHPDYVPSLLMGLKKSGPNIKGQLERLNRKRKRLTEKLAAGTEQPTCSDEPVSDEDNSLIDAVQRLDVNRTCEKETQTEDYELYLNTELYELRTLVQKLSFKQDGFKNDDSKVLFFTGLPTYCMMENIFNLLKPYIKTSAITDAFTIFLITLIKLRFNISFRYLSYQFNLSRQTISRIFFHTINVMYYRLKNFIIWPDREILQANMPCSFKEHFGNSVAIIIDCFEIYIEKSSNLEAQSSTWSNYKHNNTIKVLIGITPQGTIGFISNAYGGRCSDTFVTEDCGILEKLLPGDVVLADRGFLIKDMVELYMAVVKQPAFLKGRKQLNPTDIEETRHIAHVRVHVERVIGSLRQKYTILHQVLNIDMITKKINGVSALDKILVVCSALVNLCPSIINRDE